jgi:1-aminocyclopropane-1-carboxylate synthase
MLQLLLGDHAFMTGYVSMNQERLTQSYALAVEALRRGGVPYVPSRGSLFLWIDLSEFLADDSEEAEMRLWRDLFDATGVLLTPGVGFGHTKHGLFRVVYPSVSQKELGEALGRLERFVEARRG